jgi:hypothetical protein
MTLARLGHVIVSCTIKTGYCFYFTLIYLQPKWPIRIFLQRFTYIHGKNHTIIAVTKK